MNLELPSCSCLFLHRKGPAQALVCQCRGNARVKSIDSQPPSHTHTQNSQNLQHTSKYTWMMHFFHSACRNWRASGGASAPPEVRAGEGMVFPIAAVCVLLSFNSARTEPKPQLPFCCYPRVWLDGGTAAPCWRCPPCWLASFACPLPLASSLARLARGAAWKGERQQAPAAAGGLQRCLAFCLDFDVGGWMGRISWLWMRLRGQQGGACAWGHACSMTCRIDPLLSLRNAKARAKSRYGLTRRCVQSPPLDPPVRPPRSIETPLNSAHNSTQQIEKASHISHARRPRRRRRQRRLRAAPSAGATRAAPPRPIIIIVHLIIRDDGAARGGKGRGAGVPRGAV